MRKVNTIFVVFFVIYALGKASCAFATIAQLTVHVVEVTGEPIPEAEVTYGFTAAKTTGWGVNSIGIEKETDKNGLVTARHKTAPHITIHVENEGYYHSGTRFERFTGRSSLNRWKPWNPTIEVVLKKKRNPVAMYMKPAKWIKIPFFDNPLGFDLEKGDWVSPYGKGLISDFIFVFNLNKRAFSDYECGFTLTFSNKMDGIQEYVFNENEKSYYKWPFNAPQNGYLKELKKEISDTPAKGMSSNFNKNTNYIFRVRTQIDKDGNIIEAKYGKIVKEFGLDRSGVVRFRYMFNPDGTRNLEEDPKKNLFKKK